MARTPKAHPNAAMIEAAQAALALARDAELPMRIFDMDQPGALLGILRGENIGTLVHARRK